MTKLVTGYLQFSSYNKASVKRQKSLALPAITICSTNFINYTNFLDVISDRDTIKDFASLLMQIEQYNGTGGITEWVEKKWVKTFDAELVDKNGKKVNMFRDFQFEPFTYVLGDNEEHYQAKFAGKWINLNFGSQTVSKTTNVISHKFGKCLVLNDDQSMVQTLGGPEGGFTIDLDARIADYLPTTKTKGFMVYLRNPNETVLINKGGILVSPGKETFIGLSKSEVTRLPAKYGACINVSSEFVPGISKSVRECIQEEKLEIAVDECKCVPFYLWDRLTELNLTHYKQYWYNLVNTNSTVKVDENTICGFATQAMCDVQVLEKLVKELGKEAGCPEPCYFEQYDWHVNAGAFPATEKYWELLLKDKVTVVDEKERNYTYAQENFVRIHIYYHDIKVTKISQVKAYEIWNFIAELGGTVDMMIGFSFFTIFQVLEILIVCACYKGYYGRKPSENNIDSDVMGNDSKSVVLSKVTGVFG